MSVPCEYSCTCFPAIPVKGDRQEGKWGGGAKRGKIEKKEDVIHTDADTLTMLSDSRPVFERTPKAVFAGCASARARVLAD